MEGSGTDSNPGIYLERLRKRREILIRCLGRDWNPWRIRCLVNTKQQCQPLGTDVRFVEGQILVEYWLFKTNPVH